MGSLFEPFLDYSFMARALAGAIALSVAAPPLGLLLILRRMSLVGDALSHSILPGVAIGFLVAGLAPLALMLGGLAAGVLMAAASVALSRGTGLREDAAFAGFYLVALALGVVLVAAGGASVDLMGVLFGSVLAVDDLGLLVMVGTSSVTVLVLAVGWRPLVIGFFDPWFLQTAGGRVGLWQFGFMVLVVLNLVAAFQAMGALMAVGLMMLPALGARFWSAELALQVPAAMLGGVLASVGGLLASYHLDLPSGPAIVLVAGALALGSALLGPVDSIAVRTWRRLHLAD